MLLKADLLAYRERWAIVEAHIREERRGASIETRWRQLNSAYLLGKGLGFVRDDASKLEIYQRWAKLKQAATIQSLKL